jgi:hypothetical protein
VARTNTGVILLALVSRGEVFVLSSSDGSNDDLEETGYRLPFIFHRSLSQLFLPGAGPSWFAWALETSLQSVFAVRQVWLHGVGSGAPSQSICCSACLVP